MAASKCKLGVKRRYYQRRTIDSEFGGCLEGSEGWVFVEVSWWTLMSGGGGWEIFLDQMISHSE